MALRTTLSLCALFCALGANASAQSNGQSGGRLENFPVLGCWQKDDAIAILEAQRRDGVEKARTRVFEFFAQNKCGFGEITGVAVREVYRTDKLLIGNMYEEGEVYEFFFDKPGDNGNAGRILYILLFRPET